MLLMMMMMMDYASLFVESVILSMPIISNKNNYYTFIPSSYVFIGGAGDIYIYIYGYNLFVILYTDGVMLVWIIEYRHPTLSIVCRV